MAFVVSGLSDYTQKATEILREGIIFDEAFSEFELQTGISYKEFLNFLNTAPTLVAGTCGASDGGTTTLTERTITVIPQMSNNRFCFDDLYKKALNVDDVAKSVTVDIVDKLTELVEGKLWEGDSLGIDGWIKQFTDDSNTIDVTESSATTVSNIDDRIQDMIDKVPADMYSRGVLTIYVSYAMYNLYKVNRIQANLYHDTAVTGLGINEMWVFGYENQIKIKAVKGITDGTASTEKVHMLLTWAKNLVIGTDEINSVSSAKWVIDEVNDYAWLKAKFKLGTSYKFATEAILHTVTLP